MGVDVSTLNYERQLRVKKSCCLVFLLSLLLLLPSNIGSFPGIGKVFVLLNNVAVLFVLLQLTYTVLRIRALNFKISPVCVLGVLFYLIRIILIYFHGGIFNIGNWVTIIKRILGIVWFDKTIQEGPERYDSVMYSLWVWVFLDCLVTIISPNGSELFAGGYPLGWKNNKIEFLFLANLLALIKIEKNSLIGEKRFLKIWIIFAILSISNPILVDSGTTLMLMVLICIFPLIKKIMPEGKILSPWVILAVHSVVWFLVIINNQTETSIIGMINENLFHRDATFTGRTYLWSEAMLLIRQSFLTGYVKDIMGYGQWRIITGDLKGYEWEMAHNQILELFMQGGIVLFLCFASIIVLILWRNRICKSETLLGRWALFVLMFSYLTEAFSSNITFIILIAIYYSSQFIGNKESLFDQARKENTFIPVM